MTWTPLLSGGRIDGRYTIGLEFTGKPTRQYVARFCGDWIGARDSFDSALSLLIGERARDCESMGIANDSALSGDGPRAWRIGFAAARKCHRAYDLARVIIGAPNPYVKSETRQLWESGFASGYKRAPTA